MAKLYGAQKMVLQAIQNAQGETSTYIEDSKLTQATQIAMSDMRNWLLTLDQEEYIDLTLTNNGLAPRSRRKGGSRLDSLAPSLQLRPQNHQNPDPGQAERKPWSSASATAWF